ncbi:MULTISPECIES: protocatechuate 3,4-dioxygenase [Burkholderia]|uniref:Protocatechuate 4,5-dioxygenase subunit alpha n=1 Tax=Burkholderia paludis TaxID=1506587 RepID=A0A6J5F1D8_9BURK|nr:MULTISPECIES: protocatechuate 3,4-dioxygenase [Burkholderia]CAB3772660.1 2,3-dihydroxyphenylpropionate/2, 3-dihydroxicinnamic acid 1,2-dioxygenase [Burkholderia paludis]VWB63904.1 protocatechuate 4,5-dioxygenase subunit alpha [Burkholderia paludis]
MDRKLLESAILSIARSAESLQEFKSAPTSVGIKYGLDETWSRVIAGGDRDRLRSAGVGDGISILVSRWFRDDLGDSQNTGAFTVDKSLRIPAPNVPRNLVFAGGCSHVPDLLARPEVDPADAVERLKHGFEQLRVLLAASKPDVIIAMADCHFQSFDTGAFVVGTASSHEGSMAFFKRPDIDLRLQGEPELARTIVRDIRARGLEVEDAGEVQLDHGFIVPMRLLLPTPDTPVIPIITQPGRSFSPFNARIFGEALRPVIESSGKRVAILGTGGLSHWLDPGKFGFVDVEFDRYILDLLEAGQGLQLANLEPYALLSHGQYEILNWIIMLGAVGPGVRSRTLAYEPMSASGGGWAVVHMPLPFPAQP